MSHAAGRARRIPVWDAPVRILHVLLITGFFASWLTRHEPGPWHEWLGYVTLAVVMLRFAWGWIGTPYARFRQFVRGPLATAQYATQAVRGRQLRYIGHNPLGAWMIVALLAMIFLTCASGWLYTTDRYWGVEWVENLHGAATNVTLVLVALHVAGVVLGSWHGRENLVAAMIHGRKRAPAPGDVE